MSVWISIQHFIITHMREPKYQGARDPFRRKKCCRLADNILSKQNPYVLSIRAPRYCGSLKRESLLLLTAPLLIIKEGILIKLQN